MRNRHLCTALAAVLPVVLLVAACGSRGSEPKVSGPAQANNLARRLNARGCWLRDQNDLDSAMVYFRQALVLGEKYGLKDRVAASLQNIASVYAERPYVRQRYDYRANIDSAKMCFERTYAYCQDSGLTAQLPGLVTEMAVAIVRDPLYQFQADSLFNQARDLARQVGGKLDEGLVLFHQGQLHADQAIVRADLDGLKAAAATMDTAAALLREAGDKQAAGSSEATAEQMREMIAKIEEGSRAPKGR